MNVRRANSIASRFLSEYGMLLVLLLLCGFYSWVTIEEQHPTGTAGAERLSEQIVRGFDVASRILIVARDTSEDTRFATVLQTRLGNAGFSVTGTVTGDPADARRAIQQAADASSRIDVIACNQMTGRWTVFEDLGDLREKVGNPKIVIPESYRWPNFLKADNLLNIGNQIAVIAILAIGMTLVIITAGIDLSVGSLIALSAVVSTWLIREFAGAEQATVLGMTASSLAGIAVCACVGFFSGLMVAAFGIPAFIVTLAMMLVASGFAYLLAEGQSVYQVPDSYVWLGRGADLGIPNAVVLVVLLYAIAHVLMTRMTLGRYIYAVGGNSEAARLSGVPVKRMRMLVFTLSGALAGLGGIVMASQLKSGSPTYGAMYELYVIAAVVVGGTSLAGGEGKVLGTLIGALIIAVIQNGMNLTNVESYSQKVALGFVILGAVLLDTLKKRGFGSLRSLH